MPATDEETRALLRRAIRYATARKILRWRAKRTVCLASLCTILTIPVSAGLWLVKSPKSFRRQRLKPQQVALFEDLVLRWYIFVIRRTATAGAAIRAVIARIFQLSGLGGDDANRRAQGIS